ncbi:MAG TPA: c-type cytochrome [Ohtaekwangia sp.]|nr:c-type cytochrome [Ohtaekwangia sp.]
MQEIVTMAGRIKRMLWLVLGIIVAEIVLTIAWQKPWADHFNNAQLIEGLYQNVSQQISLIWVPPDNTTIPRDESGHLIRYGRELIEHTALYLGPQGKVMNVSNGLNCQNCHLNAGTKPFAANYSAVASNYPKFRRRSGIIENFEKRVNDCFERSLNGDGLPHDSHEMKAIIAYLKWIGKDVAKGETPRGAGLVTLPLLNRKADPIKGREYYSKHCSSCHGNTGEGVKSENKIEWKYPPLWGAYSYNTGAGLFRISKFATFIKANMPYGVTYDNPILTDEEAWDIAAFVNSMPHPHKNFPNDWPNISDKPMDHPFGPYADHFSTETHKYGPFSQVLKAKKR